MFEIKLVNKISPVGLAQLDAAAYHCDADIADADAYLVRSASLHEEVFPKSLLAIARAGAGTNNIPLDRCSQEGIVVFNTPSANANAVKELTLCGLLLASRKITAGNRWVDTLKGQGDAMSKAVEKGKSQFVGPELKGKVLGVIGLGAIGGPLANLATHLGMEVYGYDPYLSVDAAWNINKTIHRALDLKTIYENADYITLHIPATKDTANTICAETIAQMKDGVRIVNFARGELVNSADMAAALQSGKVAAYVSDFPTEELLPLDNFIGLPHLGASTPESEDNCATMAAQEIREYLEQGNIRNSVNFPALHLDPTMPYRLCALHKNTQGIVSALTTAMAEAGINIETMSSASRKDVAYTVLDLSAMPDASVLEKLNATDGIFRARAIAL